ncbi:MAG: hypothetical protein V4449_00955 [Patescibacteria group bacterium]
MAFAAEKLTHSAFESHPASGGKSVIRREDLSVPVDVANVFRGPGENAKVKNVSVEELAQAGVYYGGEVLAEGARTGQDFLQVIIQHGKFLAGLIGTLFGIGKIRQIGGAMKRKLDEWTSPYN